MKKLTILFLLISIFSFAQKAELKKEISKITEGKKATVAVSVLGIDFPFQYNNNNAAKKLPMQSVFKYHIALAVLDLVDQGKLSLDQKVFIKKSELLPNTWSPIREKNPEGNFEMPISELIEYSVAMSDNVGCDVLLRLIGGPKVVHDFLIYKGAKDTQIVYNEEIMQSAWKTQHKRPNKQQRQALIVHTLILILKTIKKNGTRIQKYGRRIQSVTNNTRRKLANIVTGKQIGRAHV